MKQVTKEEFYAAMGPLNVAPYPQADKCIWRNVRTQEIVALVTPGYRSRNADGSKIAETYQLVK